MSVENDTPTTYQPPQYEQIGPVAPQPPAGEPKRKRKSKWVLPASLTVAGLVLGFGAGVGAKPEPEVIEVEKVVEKEVEVIKEVTPGVCVDALQKAGDYIATLGKLGPIGSAAIGAAGDQDAAGLDAQTQKLKDLKVEMDEQSPSMLTATAECHALAE
jgi:hypothetical protein